MAMEKLSISLDAELAAEARRYAGSRGLSRLVNTAIRRHLQSIRLREAEEELAAKYGPISEEAERWAAAIDWPK